MNRSGCSWSERLEIGVTSCCVDWLQLADLIHPLQRKQPLSKMVLLVWCKIWEELRFFVMSLYKWGTCLAKKKKKNLSCHWFVHSALYFCSTLELGTQTHVISYMRGSALCTWKFTSCDCHSGLQYMAPNYKHTSKGDRENNSLHYNLKRTNFSKVNVNIFHYILLLVRIESAFTLTSLKRFCQC